MEPGTVVVAPSKPTMLVIGDSLCESGWPELIENHIINNSCVGGTGLIRSFMDRVPVYEHDDGYYDMTVIALGMNDAIMGVDADEFELAYRSLYDTVYNPVCLLPPLSDKPEIQVLMSEYHRRIKSFCSVAVHSAPSDALDGVHYSRDADEINRQIVSALYQ